MPSSFQTIGLIGKLGDPDTTEVLLAVKHYLLSHQHTVYLAQTTSLPSSDHLPLKTLPIATLAACCDLLIVVGGDGSLLRTAHLAVDQGKPILGMHRGHLGFLADIQPQDFERQLGAILEGQYQEEHRFLLQVDIISKRAPLIQEIALNEAALVSGDIARMIEYHITLDQQLVCNLRADGLIIATPTGSTAYALSGGGPILHPKLNAFLLVPMFPHTLSARPIVISADSTLRLQVKTLQARNLPGLTCDGRRRIPLSPQAEIVIRKKKTPLRLIHPIDYQYFEVLRNKLHWQGPHIS